jgi:hypothetical protein
MAGTKSPGMVLTVLAALLLLLFCTDLAAARKEYTKKQVGSFFRQYPRMQNLIFKAIKAQNAKQKGGSRAATDPNDCPEYTEKCCFTFAGTTECYCCAIQYPTI